MQVPSTTPTGSSSFAPTTGAAYKGGKVALADRVFQVLCSVRAPRRARSRECLHFLYSRSPPPPPMVHAANARELILLHVVTFSLPVRVRVWVLFYVPAFLSLCCACVSRFLIGSKSKTWRPKWKRCPTSRRSPRFLPYRTHSCNWKACVLVTVRPNASFFSRALGAAAGGWLAIVVCCVLHQKLQKHS